MQLILNHVEKSFGDKEVLNGVSFSCARPRRSAFEKKVTEDPSVPFIYPRFRLIACRQSYC